MYRIFFVLGFIVLVYFPGYFNNEILNYWTKEDGIYEWLGALFFFLTLVGFTLLAVKSSSYRFRRKVDLYPERKFFMFFALLFFFAFAEEVSWGQRIFNFSTPSGLEKFNRQGEFNLHNISIFHGINEEGDKKTGIMALLTMHKLYHIFFFGYLILIPVLYKYVGKIKTIVDLYRIPVPVLSIGLIFLLNFIYCSVLIRINTSVESHGIVEIKETVMAMIMVLLPIHWLDLDNRAKKDFLSS